MIGHHLVFRQRCGKVRKRPSDVVTRLPSDDVAT